MIFFAVSRVVCSITGPSWPSIDEDVVQYSADPCRYNTRPLCLLSVVLSRHRSNVWPISWRTKDRRDTSWSGVCPSLRNQRRNRRNHRPCSGTALEKGYHGSLDEAAGHLWRLLRDVLQRVVVFPGVARLFGASDGGMGYNGPT